MTPCAHPNIRHADGGRLRCDTCGEPIPKLTKAEAVAAMRDRLGVTKESSE